MVWHKWHQFPKYKCKKQILLLLLNGKKEAEFEQINGDSSKSICIRLVGEIFTGKHLNFFSIFMRFEEFLLKWVQFFNSKCLPAISAITYENVTLLRWKSKKHTKVCTTSHRLLDHHNVKNACMNKSCYFFQRGFINRAQFESSKACKAIYYIAFGKIYTKASNFNRNTLSWFIVVRLLDKR